MRTPEEILKDVPLKPKEESLFPVGTKGTGVLGLRVDKSAPQFTPMHFILEALVGGNIEATENGTPIHVRERASVVKQAVENAAERLNKGEEVGKLDMGIVAEYQFLKKLGAFRLDMGRKSIRDQILEAKSPEEVNLIYASALLVKDNMERRTWLRIENTRRVRLEELAAWARREVLRG